MTVSPALPRTEAILNGQSVEGTPPAPQRAPRPPRPPGPIFEPAWLDLAVRLTVLAIVGSPIVAMSLGASIWVFRALSGM